MHQPTASRRRTGVAAALGIAAVLTGACGGTTGTELGGSEYGADVQDVTEDGQGFYAGPYGPSFAEDIDSFVGEEVVLTGDIADALGPHASTLEPPGGAEAAPLLVVGPPGRAPDPGTGVELTGTVRADFRPDLAAEAVGVDLADDVPAGHAGEHWLEVSSVERLPTGPG